MIIGVYNMNKLHILSTRTQTSVISKILQLHEILHRQNVNKFIINILELRSFVLWGRKYPHIMST